ncbi:unnamed protein product [Vitrella brassicaformis CCMP3155]|uniref:Uncharacterized protein n=1 Tax=Vitrella brassicaformis (strain CCMP3155) TaxID=1169540 RepID=A0A0G4GWA3_VITBC|nr:unnamed protein product [Vitrella brassicaformis CCMP3155]|eukprot:CEM35020.1 unnamed protein product [Vitrella brassicaformis CCMP3155]
MQYHHFGAGDFEADRFLGRHEWWGECNDCVKLIVSNISPVTQLDSGVKQSKKRRLEFDAHSCVCVTGLPNLSSQLMHTHTENLFAWTEAIRVANSIKSTYQEIKSMLPQDDWSYLIRAEWTSTGSLSRIAQRMADVVDARVMTEEALSPGAVSTVVSSPLFEGAVNMDDAYIDQMPDEQAAVASSVLQVCLVGAALFETHQQYKKMVEGVIEVQRHSDVPGVWHAVANRRYGDIEQWVVVVEADESGRRRKELKFRLPYLDEGEMQAYAESCADPRYVAKRRGNRKAKRGSGVSVSGC